MTKRPVAKQQERTACSVRRTGADTPYIGSPDAIRYTLCAILPAVLWVFMSGAAQTFGEAAPIAQAVLNRPAAGGASADVWDSSRYIDLNDIRRGMDAYCLTDYGDAGVEKFRLKVVDVVRKIEPGVDVILVMGTDERFIHTGPVAGCSGSPVYINGRLAGALSRTWTLNKDPIYGVTPIAQMLQVGRNVTSARPPGAQTVQGGFALDVSGPIDLAQVEKEMTARGFLGSAGSSGVSTLPCPLLVSGLPPQACERLQEVVGSAGFLVVSAGAGQAGSDAGADAALVPGSALMLPLVTGDISLSVLGTVTEVRDNKVYGFGHDFLGYGPVDLPMATGKIHTVVSSLSRSFKIGSVGKIVGALRADESMAVVGQIGAQPRMFPLTIYVNRYNTTEKQTFHCRVACNQLLTGELVRTTLAAAALQRGPLPPDHTVEYRQTIDLADGGSIRSHNTSTQQGLAEILTENLGSISLLMDNPYKLADIQAIEVELNVLPEGRSAHVWSTRLSDSKVKPGQTVSLEVVLESFLADKKSYQVQFEIPPQTPPGKYSLIVCGAYEYEKFLRKVLPFRFTAYNYADLITALNDTLGIKRTRLYCLLNLPASGLALERAELPDLPATKAMVLQSTTRAVKALPYPQWIEKSLETNHVILGADVVVVEVQK